MAIVTLISDWNKDDYYVAAVKGRILSQCPGTTIVDISHKIPAFNITQAAYLLRSSYLHFPENTVHIIAVRSECDAGHPHVAVHYNNHFFIGTDNGVFGLILDGKPQESVRLENQNTGSFPELNAFAVAACDIILNKRLTEIGSKHPDLFRQVPMLPAIDEGTINGSIIYIDSYRNAITNISRELFGQIGKGRPFEIFIQSNYFRISKLNEKYHETSSGEILALFNSTGFLEIAMYEGNAAGLLNLDVSSSVRVKFSEPKTRKNKQ
ncbi:MAG: SAM-dependent chlorinase/fluorinase [Bacteroidales bacterium]|nr:SAM-dependent chlorinase/fluorinase [Bacteroidales bacterium]